MRLGARLESLFRAGWLLPRVVLRYGTTSPSRVRLPGCANWIHIDPTDVRARKKFIYDPLRRRVSPPLRFWRSFVAHLQPDIALDVGVNFGECLFGTGYPLGTRIVGVEASPMLAPYLEHSRDEHPDRERIVVHTVLVSDESADQVPFYLDTRWSGSSSATAPRGSADGIRRIERRSVRLDELVQVCEARDRTIVYKMDIEGFECRALRGFKGALDAAALAVGMIEFDSELTAAAGEQPELFIEGLIERFDVYRFDRYQANCLDRVERFADLEAQCLRDGRIHLDLALVTLGTPPSRWLAPGWTILAPDS